MIHYERNMELMICGNLLEMLTYMWSSIVDIEWRRSSACFLQAIFLLSFIFMKRSKLNAGKIQRFCSEGTLEIAVNVRPCRSVFPMSIVACGRVIP